MTLSRYLETTGTTQEDFAKRVGVRQSVVSKWVHGASAEAKHIVAVEKATAGKVRLADWVRP